ncbi:hypothetical protein EVAR_39462_1 [Eumeta japonica]|uniref:Uncharacterized protein n=1 Tax=Eumeta variegata TaxID=151549 RepID=A0A4C1W2N2_EUMVA|nr:hypothetical protein EVAR_39462_1 [Eumeta japonica]
MNSCLIDTHSVFNDINEKKKSRFKIVASAGRHASPAVIDKTRSTSGPNKSHPSRYVAQTSRAHSLRGGGLERDIRRSTKRAGCRRLCEEFSRRRRRTVS